MTTANVPATVLAPSDIARIPASAAPRAFAELVAFAESRVAETPDDHAALVLLGELRLRAGRAGEARVLLQRACLVPPSWAAYQRASALLRVAEAHDAHAFDRPAGAGIPGVLGLVRWMKTAFESHAYGR